MGFTPPELDERPLMDEPVWTRVMEALRREKCRHAAAAYEAWQRGEGAAERRAQAIVEGAAWMRMLAEKYRPEPLREMSWSEFCEEYL